MLSEINLTLETIHVKAETRKINFTWEVVVVDEIEIYEHPSVILWFFIRQKNYNFVKRLKRLK